MKETSVPKTQASVEEKARVQTYLVIAGLTLTFYVFILFLNVAIGNDYRINEWRNYLLLILVWVLNLLGLGAWLAIMTNSPKKSIALKICFYLGVLFQIFYTLKFFVNLFNLIFNS